MKRLSSWKFCKDCNDEFTSVTAELCPNCSSKFQKFKQLVKEECFKESFPVFEVNTGFQPWYELWLEHRRSHPKRGKRPRLTNEVMEKFLLLKKNASSPSNESQPIHLKKSEGEITRAV